MLDPLLPEQGQPLGSVDVPPHGRNWAETVLGVRLCPPARPPAAGPVLSGSGVTRWDAAAVQPPPQCREARPSCRPCEAAPLPVHAFGLPGSLVVLAGQTADPPTLLRLVPQMYVHDTSTRAQAPEHVSLRPGGLGGD